MIEMKCILGAVLQPCALFYRASMQFCFDKHRQKSSELFFLLPSPPFSFPFSLFFPFFLLFPEIPKMVIPASSIQKKLHPPSVNAQHSSLLLHPLYLHFPRLSFSIGLQSQTAVTATNNKKQQRNNKTPSVHPLDSVLHSPQQLGLSLLLCANVLNTWSP